MYRLRSAAACLVTLAGLLTPIAATAQNDFGTPLWPAPSSRLLFTPGVDLVGTAVPADEPAAQSPVGAAVASWEAENRDCEGCPQRRVGRAFVAATLINVLYEAGNLARGQVTARITPKTWWTNMKQGWVWDLDDFVVNQVGHPYQGSNYFNSGRANGLSYWESAGLTAFGSATWEYFGETNHASVNDLVNTTLGGIALGEMFHRTAWLVRDTRTTGRRRLWKEIAATAIDPLTGLNRFMSGDASRVSEMPEDLVPSSMRGMATAGVLFRGSNTAAFDSKGTAFLELDLVYGDPASGRSRVPYDAFTVLMRFGGGGSFTEAKVRGRLLGQPLGTNGFQLNVVQAYDYNKNNVYQFGAQAFNVAAAYTGRLSSRMALWTSGWGGLTALGAVDSIPLTGVVPKNEGSSGAGQGVSEGPRYYDYGPGSQFGGGAILTRDGQALVAFLYEARHLYSLDGIRANHFLQQLRIDLVAPLRGPLGLGVSAEYFDRRTYYQDDSNETRKFHYPQVRGYLAWRLR